MDGIQISIEKAGSQQTVSVVRIAGYIDTTTSGELERVLQTLLREQQFQIVIDLQNVDYISSAGWGIFISEIKNIRANHGDLKLACMSESVNEVYELLEFSSILVSVSTVSEAIRLFTGPEPASEPAKPAAPAVRATPVAPPAAVRPVQPAPQTVPQPAPAAKPSPEPRVAPIPVEAKPVAPVRHPNVLLERILVIVRENPRWGAWTIKSILNRRRGALPKVSWGEVRNQLNVNQLHTKTARMKFAKQA